MVRRKFFFQNGSAFQVLVNGYGESALEFNQEVGKEIVIKDVTI